MEYLEITGGNPLIGKTRVHAAKNAVLPIMAAATLASSPVEIYDCPDITDVDSMCGILSSIGVSTEKNGRTLTVFGEPTAADVPDYLSCALRSSVFMLGALLTRLGEVRLFTPGGCRIGARPMDIHIDGLCALGASVEYGDDNLRLYAKKLKGAEIRLKYPSVGATENLLLAAAGAEGETVLIGCAREPEIESLCQLLRLMGAGIEGEGTPVIKIRGTNRFDGARITPVFDRIVTGTVMTAVAVTGGRVEIDNCNSSALGAVVTSLVSKHFTVIDGGGMMTIESDGVLFPTDIVTGPYPLFPTDMQAPFMAAQCYAAGVSQTTETVFENRFAHVGELVKTGADISLENEVATVSGGKKLHGADMYAADLRGGAGLVVAALGAEGQSRVFNLRHIDRGYEKIEDVFSSLGGKISRKDDFNGLKRTF